MRRWFKPLILILAVGLLAAAANRWRAGDGLDWFSIGVAVAGVALVLFGPRLEDDAD